MDNIFNLISTLITVLSLLLAFMGTICAALYATKWEPTIRTVFKILISVLGVSIVIISIIFFSFVNQSFLHDLVIFKIPVSYIIDCIVFFMMAGGLTITIIVLKY